METTHTEEHSVNVPNALYNLPSTAPVGLLAALSIIGLAGYTLWQSGKAGLQQKLRAVLGAIVFGITGIAMLATTAHLALVQIDFTQRAANYTYTDLPTTSAIAMWVHLAVVLVLGGTMIAALEKRDVIRAATAALLFVVSLATFADLGEYRTLDDPWALAIACGWLLVVVAAVAFVAIVATVKIRAYGQRQFERGQAVALDAVAAKTSQTSTQA